MNRKLISKSNFVLRKVINKIECIDIIKDFIESILQIKINSITLNPYLSHMAKYLPSEDNFGIADVRIITNDNIEYNVGIQFIDGYYVQNKLLLYYAQIHANQLQHQNYNNTVKTITINILDFDYFNSNTYNKTIKIRESTNSEFNEDIELHVIELSKFRNQKNTISNKEDAWIAYLDGSNEKLTDYAKNNFEYIKKLDNCLENYWVNETME